MPRGIPRNKSTQRKVLHRFKIAKGHLNKVISMAENNEYCLDVVHQSMAVIAALKKANLQLLENHLNTCVADDLRLGKIEAIDEVVEILKKS